MQSLAFLSFQLQIAQQRLRETVAESPVPGKALHPNSVSGRPNHNPVAWLAFLSTRLRKRSASRRISPYDRSKIGTVFSLFVLLLVVLGVIVAACSGEPTVWMLCWPAPLVVIFTVLNFIRQGYHKRDGLLVLGSVTAPEADE